MILFIDNYDSFTYNLVQYFQELQQEVIIKNNDEISLNDVYQLSPDAIVIGPGPCEPEQAGISLELIKHFAGKTPILGICLGHQAIGQAFGGKVIRAKVVMHGRVSDIHHTQQGVFIDLPIPFKATRYHSLVVDKKLLPEELEVTAWTETSSTNDIMGEIMGIRHREFAIEGIQFHPESILSEAGYQILNNFLNQHSLAKLSTDNLPTVG